MNNRKVIEERISTYFISGEYSDGYVDVASTKDDTLIAHISRTDAEKIIKMKEKPKFYDDIALMKVIDSMRSNNQDSGCFVLYPLKTINGCWYKEFIVDNILDPSEYTNVKVLLNRL